MPIAIRKFNDTQTLGDALRTLRLSIPRTLSEMAAVTRIQKSLLDAFERNDFQQLPPPSYARRFLSTYVKAMGAEETYYLQRFDEERGSCDITHLSRLPPERARPGLRFTAAGIAKTAGALACALSIVVYLGFQVRNITAPPRLSIEAPFDGYISHEAVVKLSGTADPKATIKVNGMDVLTRPDGRFETDVALERGLNVITVEGAKRYSRVAETYRRIILEQGAGQAAINRP